MKSIIILTILFLSVLADSKAGLSKAALGKAALSKMGLKKAALKIRMKAKAKAKTQTKAMSQNRLKLKNRLKMKVTSKKSQNQLHESSRKSQSQSQSQSASRISDVPNPVTSKAQAGLYPFYPDVYEMSEEGKPQIVVVQDIEGNSLLSRHDLDFSETCNLKQGYLGMVLDTSVEKYKTAENEEKKKQIIRMRPAFTVVNNSTLSMFENENVRSLLKSISIRNKAMHTIQKVNWKGTFCFDVKYGVKPDTVEAAKEKPEDSDLQKSADALVTLCADSQAEMEGWMNAIETFHQCEVRRINVGETNIQDFNKVIKDEDEQFEEEKTNADDEQILEISNQLGNIEDSVRQNIKMVNQYKIKEDDKKNEELEVVDELQEKNNCLQEQLIEEAKKSEESLEFKLDKQITDDIKEIVKPDTLKDAYKDRLYRLLQHKQNQIKEVKKMENDLRAQIMEKSEKFERDLDSKLCTTQPIDQKSIKKACELIYKDMGYNLVIKDLMDCLNADTFCLSCCSNFIGQAKLERRKKCVDECRGAKDATAKQTELHLNVQTENALTGNEFQYQLPKEPESEDNKAKE